MIITKITEILLKVTHEKYGQAIIPDFTIPHDTSHGDYSTNIAFKLSKVLNKSPFNIAQEIVLDLQKMNFDEFDSIEAVLPGFINFTLAKKQLVSLLNQMLSDEKKIDLKGIYRNQLIVVEFTDPNPFKEFHIGHLYSNIVGESLCLLLESQGANVKRVCYQGDVGLHVAKSLWGMQMLMNEIPSDESTLTTKVQFMGKAYAFGSEQYEVSEKAKQEIIIINKKIYLEDSSIIDLYRKGRKWSLEYFEKIYRRLGTEFQRYYFESEVSQKALEYVENNLSSGVFEKSDGAIIFRGEKYGFHTRVFINKHSLPTYEAKDLALASTKYNDFKYDKSIIITGNEINEYFRVVLKALSIINPELALKTIHLSHGIVRLPEGKMSSRKGNIIAGEELLNTAVQKSLERIQKVKSDSIAHDNESFFNNKSNDNNSAQANKSISEQVGTGAVKYALLKSGIGRDIEFNFDDSVSFEGNSGPYIQYTFVRTKSILNKAEKLKITSNLDEWLPDLIQIDESILLRLLIQFPGIVREAAEALSPHIACTYLFELAKNFNLFYQKNRILDAKSPQNIQVRIMLVKGVNYVLKNGLRLLGIVAPERM